jgi:hypothetical protein
MTVPINNTAHDGNSIKHYCAKQWFDLICVAKDEIFQYSVNDAEYDECGVDTKEARDEIVNSDLKEFMDVVVGCFVLNN